MCDCSGYSLKFLELDFFLDHEFSVVPLSFLGVSGSRAFSIFFFLVSVVQMGW